MKARHFAILGLAVAAGLAAGAGLQPLLAEEAEAPLENVQVLTHVRTRSEMRALMRVQADALGVRCVHCHVAGSFHLDDKEAKRTAREMLRMVQEVNRTWFPDAERPPVTCWTCHHGGLEPESVGPGQPAAGGVGFEAAEPPGR